MSEKGIVEHEELLWSDPVTVSAVVQFLDLHQMLYRRTQEAARTILHGVGSRSQTSTPSRSLVSAIAEMVASRSDGGGIAELLQWPTDSGSKGAVLGFLGTALNVSASWLFSPKVLAIAVVGCLERRAIGGSPVKG